MYSPKWSQEVPRGEELCLILWNDLQKLKMWTLWELRDSTKGKAESWRQEVIVLRKKKGAINFKLWAAVVYLDHNWENCYETVISPGT